MGLLNEEIKVRLTNSVSSGYEHVHKVFIDPETKSGWTSSSSKSFSDGRGHSSEYHSHEIVDGKVLESDGHTHEFEMNNVISG